jgi:HAD superfamily hydrolase (TIGR01509 family)
LILDTETISVAGWEQAGREKGFTISQALSDRLFGCNLPTCKQRMEEHFGSGFDFEAAYAVRTAYVMEYTKKHGVPVKPGVTALLDLLDKRGIEKCVATSTDYKRAVELLTTVGLEKRFDRIIGGDSFENGKPNPEIFLTAARECQTPPMHALVLEDSAVGVEAAYAAGMRVIVVPDLSKPDKRTLGQVSAICKDLNEAAAVIKHI